MKPRVYLETSFISYLAGRPSRDAITAARQFSSRDFWSERRHDYELIVSELVEEEFSRGDQEQDARRKDFLREASLLPIRGGMLELARHLVGPGLIPAEIAQDAIHLASVRFPVDSELSTLGQRGDSRPHRKDSGETWLRTPHNLHLQRICGSVKLESPGEDEVLLDLYEQRTAWAAEHGHDLKRMVDHLIDRQEENPRLSRDASPEEGSSQP